MSAGTLGLQQMFSDMKDYAWQLLQGEVQLELAKEVTGSQIAELLSLYMRGVERLNSVRDERELFFRNRVTYLMMRPNVVKSFCSPVKTKTVETPACQPKQQPMPVSEPTKQTQAKPSVAGLSVNNLLRKIEQLEQKRKEIELQLAYKQEQHSLEHLTKLVTQEKTKALTLNSCIESAIADNNRKIEERIRRRQLKSMAAKSMIETPEGIKLGENKPYIREVEIIQEEATPSKCNETGKLVRVKSMGNLFDNPAIQPESAKKRRRGSAFLSSRLDLQPSLNLCS